MTPLRAVSVCDDDARMRKPGMADLPQWTARRLRGSQEPRAVVSVRVGASAAMLLVAVVTACGAADGDELFSFGEIATPPAAAEPAATTFFHLDDPFANPRPNVLRAPDDAFASPSLDPQSLEPFGLPIFEQPRNVPAGFSGRSGVVPREGPQSAHFIPREDRWRIGVPLWDRYDRDHPLMDDYPQAPGNIWNPYKQNVLKGDYPIVGQHTFLNITVADVLLNEYRQVPTPRNALEVQANGGPPFDLFGNPNQYFLSNNLIMSFDLSHGDSSFKPADWRIRITPQLNRNYTRVEELGIIGPDVEEGRDRRRKDFALQEWFAEAKLADLSADYDFLSVRAGSQPFVSDFRGFVFADTNRAVRLFGTREANRVQFNLAYFLQQEKDTNSFLNTYANRHQHVLIANYYRQDTLFPGYTAQASFHYVHDLPTQHFDQDDFLVRPDPAGIFQPHRVDAFYFGWAGDGHINRLNITHQFYQVCGYDTLNPIGGQPVHINAQMAAIELSYDRDWVRFRTSYFYASGENNPSNTTAHGFDSILDNPNFAGGQFSYWQRQGIRLFGVGLTQRGSLLANLRSSKLQGQPNYMNPGLQLFNLGMDFDITPKLRLVQNTNFLWFDETGVLKQFIFQNSIRNDIGTDISLGAEYRPRLNNNVIFLSGFACLLPGGGLRDIYDNISGPTGTLVSLFSELTLQY